MLPRRGVVDVQSRRSAALARYAALAALTLLELQGSVTFADETSSFEAQRLHVPRCWSSEVAGTWHCGTVAPRRAICARGLCTRCDDHLLARMAVAADLTIWERKPADAQFAGTHSFRCDDRPALPVHLQARHRAVRGCRVRRRRGRRACCGHVFGQMVAAPWTGACVPRICLVRCVVSRASPLSRVTEFLALSLSSRFSRPS